MNSLQRTDIARLKQELRGADEVNIHIRKDAQDIYIEADWLKGVIDYFINTTGVTDLRLEGSDATTGQE